MGNKTIKIMTTMKQAIQLFAAGLVLFFTTSLTAQTTTPGKGNPDGKARMTVEERAKKMTDHQKESLGLNDSQYKRMLEINTLHATKHEALRAEAQKDQEKRRAAAKELQTSRENSFRKVLTDEQYAKYEQNKQQMMEKAKERKGQGAENRSKWEHKGKGQHKGEGQRKGK
jgi:periplasmic protein CpxP/Spy